MDLRRTLAVSAICLGYAVFGTVVWSAHRQYGLQARIERAPLVASAEAPLKLPPPLRNRSRWRGQRGREARRGRRRRRSWHPHRNRRSPFWR